MPYIIVYLTLVCYKTINFSGSDRFIIIELDLDCMLFKVSQGNPHWNAKLLFQVSLLKSI